MSDPPQLSSGEFARRTRLSRKALRVYERNGLLPPVEIDPNTGYRRYAPGQVRTGQIVGLLRGADLSLTEIRLVLDDLERGPAAAVARLDELVGHAERRHARRMLVLRHLKTTLRRGEDSMFTIRTRHVAARRFMSIQRRLHAPQTDAFVGEAKVAFAAQLGDLAPTGPLTLIFHGIVDGESDGPLEATLACPEEVGPSATVGIRTEPAHDEAYTTITRSQWAYPAILAAYDAVASSPEVTGRPGSQLSCREVYVADPDAIAEHDLICDIAYPLGSP